ncbi:uncharacterized protein LOC134660090 isoform X4 [Cydia amplana]|uniref:uncharacterized protein LOC134660090 isoform X4 n=1 Tax=Cydia amplana TaxID=1869771 RepID=UPI002FE6707A
MLSVWISRTSTSPSWPALGNYFASVARWMPKVRLCLRRVPVRASIKIICFGESQRCQGCSACRPHHAGQLQLDQLHQREAAQQAAASGFLHGLHCDRILCQRRRSTRCSGIGAWSSSDFIFGTDLK